MSAKRKYLDFAEEQEGTVKLTSDGDLLLKSLLDKQLSKETNLSIELKREKEFISTEYVPISNFVSGLNSSREIQKTSSYCEELEEMKMAGLSDEEIRFYEDSKKGLDFLKVKHKNLDHDYISDKIKNICSQLERYNFRTHKAESSVVTKMGRHWTEFMLSVKPTSIETSLLKFAINNEKTKCTNLPSTMDDIKNIEQDLMNSKSYVKFPNTSKIRKRARSLKNRIESIKLEVEEPANIPGNVHSHHKFYVENSKWDEKLPEVKNFKNASQQKLYSCELKGSSNLYTIKDGTIFQIDSKLDVNYKDCKRLTLGEIKEIPKFAQYHPGIPSKILFLKNLPSVSEFDIDKLFMLFNFKTESVKILKGKMRGAFVELRNILIAEQALNSLNGIILMNKPLIIEFGKKS